MVSSFWLSCAPSAPPFLPSKNQYQNHESHVEMVAVAWAAFVHRSNLHPNCNCNLSGTKDKFDLKESCERSRLFGIYNIIWSIYMCGWSISCLPIYFLADGGDRRGAIKRHMPSISSRVFVYIMVPLWGLIHGLIQLAK